VLARASRKQLASCLRSCCVRVVVQYCTYFRGLHHLFSTIEASYTVQ
jgi:hypothetical protein